MRAGAAIELVNLREVGVGERHFGIENVAAAGANGCLPCVFRPPVTWLESTKT